MTEVCCAGFVRFVTLRTGWLRSPFMRLVLPPRSAWGKQSRCHRQSPTKAANEAGCEHARFLSGVHMGKQWACVPKFGRSLATSGTQKVQPPALIRSLAKMGATDATKRQTKMGNLTAQVRKINNSTIR